MHPEDKVLIPHRSDGDANLLDAVLIVAVVIAVSITAWTSLRRHLGLVCWLPPTSIFEVIESPISGIKILTRICVVGLRRVVFQASFAP